MHEGRRITRSHTLTINATPDEAFVYLCPQREHDYLEHWKADILFSESGLVENGCIFRTQRPDDEAATIWIVTEHDPQRHVVRIAMTTPGSRVGRLKVECADAGDERCIVTFSYEITAITEAGQRYLDTHFTAEAFTAQMRGYEIAWNHYLKTGRLFRSTK
jgi:hypothetical protein